MLSGTLILISGFRGYGGWVTWQPIMKNIGTLWCRVEDWMLSLTFIKQLMCNRRKWQLYGRCLTFSVMGNALKINTITSRFLFFVRLFLIILCHQLIQKLFRIACGVFLIYPVFQMGNFSPVSMTIKYSLNSYNISHNRSFELLCLPWGYVEILLLIKIILTVVSFFLVKLLISYQICCLMKKKLSEKKWYGYYLIL